MTLAALESWGDRAFQLPPALPCAAVQDQITPELCAWYRRLYDSMRISSAPAVSAAVARIARERARYVEIEAHTGVPWRVVGVIHYLECNCNFTQHLHNGDPLTARTVQLPRGCPIAGKAPFTWDVFAVDALQYDGLAGQSDWSLEATLFRLEDYNGWGYYRAGKLSLRTSGASAITTSKANT